MIEAVGYLASVLVLCTFCTKTMAPLRMFAIGSNVAFIAYGAALALHPILILHALLLPLNAWRLWQLLRLGRAARSVAGAPRPFGALAPHASRSRRRRGDVLMRRGERSDALYLVIEGKLRVVEAEAELGPGAIVGEIGVLGRARTRTATVVAASDCVLGRICARDVRRLYDAIPALRLPLVGLIIDRLSRDAERRSGACAPLTGG